jgi:superoxide dismutase, Cu-Zn family
MRAFVVVATGLLAISSGSCGGAETCAGMACAAAPVRAHATFVPKEGVHVSGTVTMVERGGAVTVTVDVAGASPGVHGIHIHEAGDCSAPDFSSAGGHFDPAGAPHACPPDPKRHAGDLGNLDVGADRVGHLQISSDLFTLSPGLRSVVGRALILHEGPDDCHSQPSGDSGARIACAVIRLE